MLRYEKSFERTNKNTGEHTSLRYSTERNEDTYLDLDKESGLVSVKCSADLLTLHVDSLFSIAGYKIGKLVYGGTQWECLAQDKEIGPVFKAISSVPILRNGTNCTPTTISFEAKDASPFAFFGRS